MLTMTFACGVFLLGPSAGEPGHAVEVQERTQQVVDSLFDREYFAAVVAKDRTARFYLGG